jgi:PEP-CTERM motif
MAMRPKVALRSVFALILLTILGMVRTDPARALLLGAEPGEALSEAVLSACEHLIGPNLCRKYRISFYIDPSGSDISSFQLEIDYDPSKWIFDAAASGPLCAFASGDSPCPANSAAVGTFPIADGASSPGSLLPGSTITMTAAGGVVTVDYELASPVDLSLDQNVFALAFDAVDAVDLSHPPTATYFGSPGSYQFSVPSFSCNNQVPPPCGGDPAIYGADINATFVPEPSTWAMMLLGFVGLGYAGWRQSSKLRVATT